MIKWCTHTEGVLPYVAHAVVYHHLWCGPAVASHQKSHAPVVCLGPRWWFYSSSTIFWLILDMGRDGMEALLHVGWQSPVAASNGNDIIGRGCTGEFSCAKARKKFWFHVRKKKKEAKKHHEKTIRATPKTGDFFFFRRWWPISTCGRYFANNSCHPQIGDFLFWQWWPISTCGCYFAKLTSPPPGFSDVVAHGFCMSVRGLRG